MAKLKAHGAELYRVELPAARNAYFADGHILRDTGAGWKLWRRFKPGVNVAAAAAQKREHFENPPDTSFHRSNYRRAIVAEWPSLEKRVRFASAADLPGDDTDGIWSEMSEFKCDVDLDTIEELVRLRNRAIEEAKEAERLKALPALTPVALVPA